MNAPSGPPPTPPSESRPSESSPAESSPAESSPPESSPPDSSPGDPSSVGDPARSLLNRARSDAHAKGRVPRTKGAQERARRDGATSRSAPGADDRDPQPLSNTVSRLLVEQGWQVDVAVHGVMTRWAEIVGPDVAAHSTPERYLEGELAIRAESTAWATQLRLLAPNLVHRLNSVLGDGTVRVVVVRGPDAPRWSHGRRSVPGRGPRDTYG